MSSIEGLNQEIERLVLHPGIAGRANRLDQVSALRFTPEEGGRDSPLVSGSRSANTHTPVQDQDPDTGFFTHLQSHPSDDDSLSPTDGATPEDAPLGQPSRSFARIGSAESSPRINKFMAQLPPEGCERVQLLSRAADHPTGANQSHIIINKPVAGFQLRPSQGSAFRVAASLASAQPPENPIECPAAVVTAEEVAGAVAVLEE